MFAFAVHFKNLAALDSEIRSGQPNATVLAERLKVNRRTVQRYLKFLREELGAPLEYDRDQNGFHYSGKWDFGKALLDWFND